jgi:hypothetical protein
VSVSLHTAVIGTYRQILPQIDRLLGKAEAHCAANDLSDEALTGAKLADDMWDFAKQVFECAHHSGRAIVEAVEPGELDDIAGRAMRFEFGAMRMDFTVEDFLLSFSLPNFYFHAATAYGLLRGKGLAIGKGVFWAG